MRGITTITWVLGVYLLAAGAAHAGLRHVFPPLTPDDIEIINHTARDKMQGRPAGTVLEWENPKSRHAGTVTLLRVFERKGRECRELRHHIKVRQSMPWEVDVTICRDEDGEWQPAAN